MRHDQLKWRRSNDKQPHSMYRSYHNMAEQILFLGIYKQNNVQINRQILSIPSNQSRKAFGFASLKARLGSSMYINSQLFDNVRETSSGLAGCIQLPFLSAHI